MAKPFEIVAGPLTIWLAPPETAFPAIGADPAGPWVMVGTSGTRNYSNDGVSLQLNQTVAEARPAGALGPVKAWRTEEDALFGVTLWDLTLEQFTLALNGVVPAATAAGAGTAGFKKLGLSRGHDVKTYSLLARGASPYADDMIAQFEVPHCYQSGSPNSVFNKGVPVGLQLQWKALEDLEAASEDERFGRLLAQHQAPLP